MENARPAEGEGLWASLKATLDVQQYKPKQAEGVVCKQMADRNGRHFMLKNGRTHSYERLAPEEYWIWQRMDGETTVQQLVLAYFLEYHAFAFSGILSLIERLRQRCMLSELPANLYGQVAAAIQRQGWLHRLAWLGRAAFTRELAIHNFDQHLARLHRWGGWLLFTWPVQVLFLLISVIGTYLFIRLAGDPRYQLLGGDKVLRLALLSYLPAVIHEFGHAITAKHMGAEVQRGGVMLYYGLPAAFVETTDMWMFGKRARLAVTWAGPYTGYILGGLCSILVYGFPGMPSSYSTILLQIAFAALFGNTLNVLPLLKLDGYYLLADALEIPRLRERSMEFVSRYLVGKIKTREKWTRDERIFLVYGVLAFLSTFYFTSAAIRFWDRQASRSIADLLNLQGDLPAKVADALVILVAISSIFLALAFLRRAAGQLVNWMRQRGLLSTRLRAGAAILGIAILLVLLPPLLLPFLGGWIMLLIAAGAFAVAAWLATSIFRSMRGSVHAGIWLSAALGLLAGAAGLVGRSQPRFAALGSIPYAGGVVLLVLFFLLSHRFRHGMRGSWREISLTLVATGTAAWVVSLAPIAEAGALAGLLISGGLIHWLMRPPTHVEVQAEGQVASTRAQMVDSFTAITKIILNELELDFGKQTRLWVEAKAYRPKGKSTESAEFSKSVTGMTPVDYGGAMAMSLAELLTDVERAAGKRYARHALALGFDQLDWERQEVIEDYLLKYVEQAAGLSNQLRQPYSGVHELVRSLPMSLALTDKQISTLCRRLRSRRVGRGEIIIRRGEFTDHFCIIHMGSVEMIGDIDQARGQFPLTSTIAVMDKNCTMFIPDKSKLIAKLGRGDYFGEQTLLTGEKSSVLVRALTSVELFTLGRHDFNQLVRTWIQSEKLHQKDHSRLRLLRQIPLLSQLEGFDLRVLAAKLEPVALNEGETILRQGDPGECFYIIESGKVSVQVDSRECAVLGVGEYFGETALIMNVPRTATVSATQRTVLLALKGDDFREMLQTSRATQQAAERASSRRMLAREGWLRQHESQQPGFQAS